MEHTLAQQRLGTEGDCPLVFVVHKESSVVVFLPPSLVPLLIGPLLPSSTRSSSGAHPDRGRIEVLSVISERIYK